MDIIHKLAKIESEYAWEIFYQCVHPDEMVREAGRKLELEINTKKRNILSKLEPIDNLDNKEHIKNLNNEILLNKPELLEINEEIDILSQEFNKNIVESNPIMRLNEDDYMSFDKYGHEFTLTNDKYTYILKYCNDPTIRKNAYIIYNNIAENNTSILNDIRAKRNIIANILGYDAYSSLMLSFNYIKTSDKLNKFLKDFYNYVLPINIKQIKKLEEYFNTNVNSITDITYYTTKYLDENYIDSDSLRDYFELNHVFQEMISIYEELFNCNIQYKDAELYHNDVRMIEVSTEKSIGHIILDLKQRENKFSHPSNFPIIRRHVYPDYIQNPVTALLTSFDNDHITHDNVITLFHEFGHSMHEVLNLSDYVNSGGTFCTKDLVEIPSMVLENLAWDRDILKRISKHKDTSIPLSDEQIDNLISSRYSCKANYYLIQIAYSLFDINFYDNKIQLEDFSKYICEITHLDECKTNRQNRFIHLVGYATRYYTYLYNIVYADKIYNKIKSPEYMNFIKYSTDENFSALGEYDIKLFVKKID